MERTLLRATFAWERTIIFFNEHFL